MFLPAHNGFEIKYATESVFPQHFVDLTLNQNEQHSFIWKLIEAAQNQRQDSNHFVLANIIDKSKINESDIKNDDDHIFRITPKPIVIKDHKSHPKPESDYNLDFEPHNGYNGNKYGSDTLTPNNHHHLSNQQKDQPLSNNRLETGFIPTVDPFNAMQKRHGASDITKSPHDRFCRKLCPLCERHFGLRFSTLCWIECRDGGPVVDACIAVVYGVKKEKD